MTGRPALLALTPLCWLATACGHAGGSGGDAGGGIIPDADREQPNCEGTASLTRVEIEHGGRTRSALITLPSGAGTAPMPLVLNFHGNTHSPQQQRMISRMDATADAMGFVVAYPEGIANSFNAGICCGEAQAMDVDDVGFTRALIEEISEQVCIDPERIYATGLSNGGYLVHRLACEAPELFRAFSAVAGLLALPACQPSVPRPILNFHGTADPVVPYEGNAFLDSAPATMERWAERNGCTAPPSSTLAVGDTSCMRYEGCTDDSSVELCTIDEGGHTWPGGAPMPEFGKTSTDVQANEWMWQFFVEHSP